MKKITYLILSAFIGLLTGCNDNFLDQAPLDGLSNSSFWKNENDAKVALNACYRGWYSGDAVIYLDCASDNAHNPYPWEGYTVLGNGKASSTDSGANYWDFSNIRKCNVFLENIDQVEMNESLRNRFKAEARFLRAFRYFLMNRAFGDVPLVTKTLTTAEANSTARNASAEVVKFVLDELTAISAEGILPDTYEGSDVGRITRGAALALKGRVELYEAKYQDCINTYNQVMTLGYSLFDNYTDLFRVQNENNSEVILDVQYMPNDYVWAVGVMPPMTSGGWCSIVPTQSLVDAYECTNGKTISDPASGYNPENPYANRDPRLDATVIRPGTMYNGSYYDPITPTSPDYYSPYGNSKSGYLVKKFTANLPDHKDMWKAELNMSIIRYAEVLLSYAEAKIELNQIDESVYTAINAVRTRAGLPEADRTLYADQAKMRELVRRERRAELAMEGLRWYDIQRWKIGKQVMEGDVYGSRLGTVNKETGVITFNDKRIFVEQRLFDESKNYLWPVPQSELDANAALSPNNPGY